MVTTRDARRAGTRMKDLMKAGPRAVSARYDRRLSRIVVALSSGIELTFPPEMAEGLAGASPRELSKIEVSPTGFGLHFPELDADLYLPALLEGVLGSPAWMAGLMGRKGGKATSDAKRSAARRNGRLGGRPRKSAAA